MVLRLIEGFETRQTTTTKLDLAWIRSGSVVGFPAGRKAGNGCQSLSLTLTSVQLVDPDENTWIVGFALRRLDVGTPQSVLGSGASVGVQIQNAGGDQCELLMVDADPGAYQWQLKRGSTVIDTSSSSFFAGNVQSWRYFQLKVTVRTGVNGAYELRSYDLDNNSNVEMSGSGVNLANQATDGADRVRFSWNVGTGANLSHILYDDIVVMDASGSLNNDFLANPAIVQGALPDANGNQNDWIASGAGSNFQQVDDPANQATDTDKVTAETVTDVDLYSYSNFPLIPSSNTIFGIQVFTAAAMAASGTRTIRVRVRSGIDEAFGSNFVLNDLILKGFRQMFDENPTGTPAAWTKTSLEAAQFGVEVQA